MKGLASVLAAAAVWVLAGATSASAQNDTDYQGQARSYLEAGMDAHTEHGYRADSSIPDLIVPLRLEHPKLWPVRLRGGVNYRVFAACDNDCSDLDMEIYDANGELADKDTATNDTPYVQVTPAQSGTYYVRLWVYACQTEPCYAAARVVSGGTPAEREDEPSDDQANDDYEGVVRSELDSAAAAHIAAGYHAIGEDTVVPIPLEGDGHRDSVQLQGGHAYIFQGACDQDCGDVDMEILDPTGHQVAQDVADNDRPSVAVTPAQDGDYTVRIWLAQCRQEPCYVGYRTFQH